MADLQTTHSGSGGILGWTCTLFLFIVAKMTLSEWASAATLISGIMVAMINLPKWSEIYIPKITRLYNKLFKRK